MGPTVFGYLAAYVTHNYTWLWLDLPFALLVLAGLFFMIAGEVEENRKIEKDRRA
jgi:MFS family permease